MVPCLSPSQQNMFLPKSQTVSLEFNIQINQKIWEHFQAMPAYLFHFQVSYQTSLEKNRNTLGFAIEIMQNSWFQQFS